MLHGYNGSNENPSKGEKHNTLGHRFEDEWGVISADEPPNFAYTTS
jgi:hypothetical protein